MNKNTMQLGSKTNQTMTVEEAKKKGILVDCIFCPYCRTILRHAFGINKLECPKCGNVFDFIEHIFKDLKYE